jgi:hypothetical protein
MPEAKLVASSPVVEFAAVRVAKPPSALPVQVEAVCAVDRRLPAAQEGNLIVCTGTPR